MKPIVNVDVTNSANQKTVTLRLNRYLKGSLSVPSVHFFSSKKVDAVGVIVSEQLPGGAPIFAEKTAAERDAVVNDQINTSSVNPIIRLAETFLMRESLLEEQGKETHPLIANVLYHVLDNQEEITNALDRVSTNIDPLSLFGDKKEKTKHG